MKITSYSEMPEEAQGNLMLIYGPPGVGKTGTTLQTAADPITLITAEKRKVRTTVSAINRPSLQLSIGIYEGFEDCVDVLRHPDNFSGTRTILLDSLTHLMVSHLAFEILDENYNAKTEEEKRKMEKELTTKVKMTKEAYGSMADNMVRIMNALQDLTMAGYDVICTARSEERPKYNRTIGYGPSLSGQKFGNVMPGYFDFIAMLEPDEPENDDGTPMDLPSYDSDIRTLWRYHAPLASFDSNDSYLAKWTGPFPPKGIKQRKFHVEKLLKEANGVFK